MRLGRLPLTVLSLVALTSGAGCGIISKDLEGDVRFDFEINGDEGESTYDDTVTFDPNSNQDVKDNRDKVKEGAVVAISIEVNEILPGNRARIVAGQVDVKKTSAPDNQFITAVGRWEGVPLYSCAANSADPTVCENEQPAIGQVFRLEIPLATQQELSKLVFEGQESLDFRMRGTGYDWSLRPVAPTRLKGEVTVKLDFTVSAP